MPNTLDVAVQRKLIADLERDGRSTQEAEIRLKGMLEAIASFRHSGGDMDRPGKARAGGEARTIDVGAAP
jgi:hypothetical protein